MNYRILGLSGLRVSAIGKHATPAQISLAWMMCKRPWIVPIPGTRRLCRLKENIGEADLRLSPEEVRSIDSALDNMNMSDVFSGSPIKGRLKTTGRYPDYRFLYSFGVKPVWCLKNLPK